MCVSEREREKEPSGMLDQCFSTFFWFTAPSRLKTIDDPATLANYYFAVPLKLIHKFL